MPAQVAGVTFGGGSGESPPVLLGSIFYEGQKLVKDPIRGIFDAEAAYGQIREIETLSEKYGIPVVLDVTALSPVAMRNYLEFVGEHSSLSFLIDSSDLASRLAGVEVVVQRKWQQRAIYNSLTVEYDEEELTILKLHRLGGIILLALDQNDYSARGSVAQVRELLGIASDLGPLLVDSCVLDQVSLGVAADIAGVLRDEFKFPVGCAPCNGVFLWKRLLGESQETFAAILAATMGYALRCGLDFLFIGPLISCRFLIPALAVASAYDGYRRQDAGKSVEVSHPLRRLSKVGC